MSQVAVESNVKIFFNYVLSHFCYKTELLAFTPFLFGSYPSTSKCLAHTPLWFACILQVNWLDRWCFSFTVFNKTNPLRRYVQRRYFKICEWWKFFTYYWILTPKKRAPGVQLDFKYIYWIIASLVLWGYFCSKKITSGIMFRYTIVNTSDTLSYLGYNQTLSTFLEFFWSFIPFTHSLQISSKQVIGYWFNFDQGMSEIDIFADILYTKVLSLW